MAVSERATTIGALSLVLGPGLMSMGDLMHPAESWDPAVQVAILADSASHWYSAHLLLLIGMFLLVPGIHELTRLTSMRRPSAGYVARVLMFISVGALSAVFAFEMLLGAFITGGADQATAVALVQAFQSPAIFGALGPGLLAFFVGAGILVATLVSPAGPYRWPAIVFGVGALLILAEITLAQVLLSQIGNILILLGGLGFARQLIREQPSRAFPRP
jgi:hypothetical protein